MCGIERPAHGVLIKYFHLYITLVKFKAKRS